MEYVKLCSLTKNHHRFLTKPWLGMSANLRGIFLIRFLLYHMTLIVHKLFKNGCTVVAYRDKEPIILTVPGVNCVVLGGMKRVTNCENLIDFF